MKIHKNGDFRHISGITRLCAKNQKKLIMKSRENAKKTGFSKIGLAHILDIAILHQCAKFHEKL